MQDCLAHFLWPTEPAGVFDHASDLAAYIREERPNLKIYGACYPEKHPQSATLEDDIDIPSDPGIGGRFSAAA